MSKINKIIECLILLFLFLLPWQAVWIWHVGLLNGVKWEYGTYLLYGTELIFWLAAITFLVKMVLSGFRIHKPVVDRSKRVVFLSSVTLIAWALISVMWSGDKFLSYYNWFHLAEAMALIFMIASLKNLDIKKIYWALALSGVAQAILAVVQFVMQRVVGGKWFGIAEQVPARLGAIVIEVNGERLLRPYGSFTHSNILAGFLVVCLLVAVFLYFKYRSSWLKYLATVLVLINLTGIIITFSRAAILSTIVGLIIMVIIYVCRQKKETLQLVGMMLVMAGVMVLILRPLLLVRLSVSGRLENKSIEQRVDYINQAKNVIASNPLIGTGIGTYTLDLYKVNSILPVWDYQPVHNIYLLIWAELGIVGLFIFLSWCGSILVYAILRRRPVAIIFLALLIIGFFDHYLWTQYVGIMVLALSAALILKPENYE